MDKSWSKDLLKDNISLNAERRRQINVLRNLIGFQNLSLRRQKVIEHLLYFQERGLRHGHSSRFYAVEELNTHITDDVMVFDTQTLERLSDSLEEDFLLHTRKYPKSQDVVARWYCHYTIFFIEENITLPAFYPSDVKDDFFNAEYRHYDNIEVLKSVLLELGAPQVIHISESFDNNRLTKLHSFLYLGNLDGELMCFEKQDNNKPFQIRDLKSVLEEYDETDLYIGIRKLKQNIL